MDMVDRIAQSKRGITFIATKFDETNDAIAAAPTELATFIGTEANAIAARRKAYEDKVAAAKKAVEENKAAVLAKDGKLPEPITANLTMGR